MLTVSFFRVGCSEFDKLWWVFCVDLDVDSFLFFEEGAAILAIDAGDLFAWMLTASFL
jgi:hypothetical protein